MQPTSSAKWARCIKAGGRRRGGSILWRIRVHTQGSVYRRTAFQPQADSLFLIVVCAQRVIESKHCGITRNIHTKNGLLLRMTIEHRPQTKWKPLDELRYACRNVRHIYRTRLDAEHLLAVLLNSSTNGTCRSLSLFNSFMFIHRSVRKDESTSSIAKLLNQLLSALKSEPGSESE